MTKKEYREVFFKKKKKDGKNSKNKGDDRKGVTISAELKYKLRQISGVAGINVLSIGNLLDNIIEHHVATYNEPLKDLFEDNANMFR